MKISSWRERKRKSACSDIDEYEEMLCHKQKLLKMRFLIINAETLSQKKFVDELCYDVTLDSIISVILKNAETGFFKVGRAKTANMYMHTQANADVIANFFSFVFLKEKRRRLQ